MRSSSKSRNRGKNANRRGNNGGSIINRVFESAGPEGKVRGTPQQIIDKYISLAHDSQLSGDRVSAENFMQHAEHYSRILADAQKEMAEKHFDTMPSHLNNVSKIQNDVDNKSNSDLLIDANKLATQNKTAVEIDKFGTNKKPTEECSPKNLVIEKSKNKNIPENEISDTPTQRVDVKQVITEVD